MSGLDDHNARMDMLDKQQDIVWLDEKVSDICPTLSYLSIMLFNGIGIET